MKSDKFMRLLWNASYAIMLAVLAFYLIALLEKDRSVGAIAYSQFEQALQSGRVERVVISDRRLIGYLKAGDRDGKQLLITNRVEPDLAARLERIAS